VCVLPSLDPPLRPPSNTQDTQTNRHTPDFVVGAGVTTSTIARAAHDTFVEDRLHLNGVCRRSKWPRGLRHTSTHTHARARTHTHHLHAHTHIPTSHSHPPLSVCEGVCVCAVLFSAIFLFSAAIGVCEIMKGAARWQESGAARQKRRADILSFPCAKKFLSTHAKM
jgi:hypothetical protein